MVGVLAYDNGFYVFIALILERIENVVHIGIYLVMSILILEKLTQRKIVRLFKLICE